MTQAITFILRERGFRAGALRIGYQSCDDSTTQTGIFDRAKCAANAKAFAANRTVIGVIGPYNSGCAVEQIPIAGRAPGGPLAMISPTNSDVLLTREGPAAPEGSLAALYPTGVRNYARLYPTEAAQSAADALFAQHLGARRVFALSDGGYGESFSFYFRRAARSLGLRLAGSARWNQRAAGYRGLARQVAAARPDAVFLGGLLDTNGAAVVKALRAALPRDVELIAVDGFLPIARLFELAGRSAKGLLVSFGGLPQQLLHREGRKFVSDFAATQPDATVHSHSVLAAAATAALLDAIERSDGDRAQVSKRLLASRPRRSILGPFEFDANGDIVPSPITVVRAQRGGGSKAIESIDGARVQRVVRPPASLMR
jgi:branched-chain amino acid transport system substrate-binding protein